MQYLDTVASTGSVHGANLQDNMPDRSVYSDPKQVDDDTRDLKADAVKVKKSETVPSLKDEAEDLAQRTNEKQEKLSEKELEEQKQKAKELSAKLNAQNIGLSFSVDDATSDTVINVTNRSTDDLVRQIPSEDMLRFQKIISDFEDKTKCQVGDEISKQKSNDMLKGLILDDLV